MTLRSLISASANRKLPKQSQRTKNLSSCWASTMLNYKCAHFIFSFVVSFGILCTINILWQSSQQLSNFSVVFTRAGTSTSTTTTDTTASWDQYNPLGIPKGQPPNLPSIRVEKKEEEVHRKELYGGAGDKKHLGGFTDFDRHGVSPAVWKHLIQNINVHSLIDVGCGRGISTLWFLKHGVDVLCVEGSHDAVEKSMLPDPDNHVVEHDFSRGPWWPEKTYDAAWSVEFLEHVGVQHHFNYLTVFRKAAVIFVTTSRHGGWHHTEVHMDDWWIRKYEAYGLRYSPELSQEIKTICLQERDDKDAKPSPNGKPYNGQHISFSMKVFINPVVAALPQHAHIFFEPGCYQGKNVTSGIIHRHCGTGKIGDTETPLPDSFYPLKLTPEMDKEWEEEVKKHIVIENVR